MKPAMRLSAISAAAIAVAVAGAVPAVAHHSTNLWYDMAKTQTVEGSFVALKWINPHSVLEVEVKNANGTGDKWQMETHGNAVLARAGWRPNMFTPGEKLVVTGNPSRKGLKTLSLLEVKTASGKDYKVNPSN